MTKENTSPNSNENKISLKKLVEESGVMNQHPEEQKRLLDKLGSFSDEKRTQLREVFENEKEKRAELDAEGEKLINEAEVKIKDFKKGKKRNERKRAEKKERFTEEKFAKDLLTKLDSLE